MKIHIIGGPGSGKSYLAEKLSKQLGIPTEAMAAALTIEILTDFFVTAFERFVLPFFADQRDIEPFHDRQ